MPFSPTLRSALNPTLFVVEANLRVEESRALVTVSVKKDDGKTWGVPSGVDTREISWEPGRACTRSGRSNGCVQGS